MSNSDIIMQFLDKSKPNGLCDDCLSNVLKIKRRQQVNQLCTKLYSKRQISRKKLQCHGCHKVKLVNSIVKEPFIFVEGAVKKEDDLLKNNTKKKTYDIDLDINDMRSHIIRFCKELWKRNISPEEPSNLPGITSSLRNKGILPSHPANMMLTINNLRNAHDYEKQPLGTNETAVAKSAWEIIEEWATANYKDLWLQTDR